MSLLDKVEKKIEDLEEAVEHIEETGPFDEEIDPSNPFTKSQIILFSVGNLIVVGGVSLLVKFMLSGLAAILALIFAVGTFMIAGIAMLISKHRTHKLTGLIICLTNILLMLWLWRG